MIDSSAPRSPEAIEDNFFVAFIEAHLPEDTGEAGARSAEYQLALADQLIPVDKIVFENQDFARIDEDPGPGSNEYEIRLYSSLTGDEPLIEIWWNDHAGFHRWEDGNRPKLDEAGVKEWVTKLQELESSGLLTPAQTQ